MNLDPCAFCGSQPVLERPKPDGTVWDTSGRLVCRAIGCCGQGKSAAFRFGFERAWNQRQQSYQSIQRRAKSVIPPLFAAAAIGAQQ